VVLVHRFASRGRAVLARAALLTIGLAVLAGCASPAPSSSPTTASAPTAAPAGAPTAAAGAAKPAATGTKTQLPATIKATALIDLTGPAAFAGLRAQDGLQLGLDEINSSGLLGSSKLALDIVDAASNKQQTVDAMTRVASDESVLAVFGPLGGAQTLAGAPIAQSKGLPEIAIESGAPGVIETGNFVFRITPPQASFVGVTADYLVKTKGVKKVALIYDSSNATLADLGKTAFPKEFQSRGASVVGSETYQTGQVDYNAIITKLQQANPDAFGVLSVGADNATIVGQLRQAGFDGPIFGQSSMGAGNLNPVAAQAEGVVWSVTFDPNSALPSVQKFVKAWQAKKPNDAPSVYSAESYDAIYLLAYGLQQASAATRDGIRQGLEAATASGFEGAVGKYAFTDRDARIGGTLVQYQGGKEVFVH
jgi:branched-chain amino acid transport system substrate-binding protein